MRFDHKCTLFAVLDLYIILDFNLLFKFTKSLWDVFVFVIKSELQIGTPGFLFCFVFFFLLLAFDRPSSSRWARAATN